LFWCPIFHGAFTGKDMTDFFAAQSAGVGWQQIPRVPGPIRRQTRHGKSSSQPGVVQNATHKFSREKGQSWENDDFCARSCLPTNRDSCNEGLLSAIVSPPHTSRLSKDSLSRFMRCRYKLQFMFAQLFAREIVSGHGKNLLS